MTLPLSPWDEVTIKQLLGMVDDDVDVAALDPACTTSSQIDEILRTATIDTDRSAADGEALVRGLMRGSADA